MNPEAIRLLSDLLGPSNLKTALEDRITYAFDASGTRAIPEAVLFPRTREDVPEIVKIAARFGIPITARGAGSGLTGGAVAPSSGMVLDMSCLDRIIRIDPGNLLAEVEPGVVTAELQAAVEREGLYYPPDPASGSFSTIGGNIAENAGGMRAVKYGVTRNYVMGLEVVLASGEVIHTGSKCLKDVVGYDLTTLFVGSEGTLGIITRAILRLLPLPEARRTLLALFPSMSKAAETVPRLFKSRVVPSTLEFMDRVCIEVVSEYLESGFPENAEAVLLIEVDGRRSAVNEEMGEVHRVCKEQGAMEIQTAASESERDVLWRSRRSIHNALRRLRPRWEEEDVSVPIASIPAMIETLEQIRRSHGLLLACFGHVGDGNLHISYVPKDETATDSLRLGRARHDILRAAVDLEGRIAAEHGIGSIKRKEIGWNLDQPTLHLMETVKHLLDPDGIFNPGKIFPGEEAGSHAS
ncbi:MAG: FAD-binding protein [Deltaproteobacteria bacterium]|nr:FAD-binding protein [Deltaproteobacteria bacterium]